ncbi:hypothetical protein GO285_01472 [Ralstonia solanacearum]|nr:hypothetical protein [Ralstonia solanacearum]NKG06770.1 hypothetical protein [Ralstonia solanacearum]NKG09685.1 hypothetical protein [Ralstonia solanacearum]
MSLIRSIQADAIEASSSVSSLLRKCKLLASRVGHAQLEQWVDLELRGYPDGADLPSYRVTPVVSYGSFVGSFGMQAPKLQIPVFVLPEHLREPYSAARMDQAISSYESLVQGDKPSTVKIEWNVALAIKYASTLTPDMQCVAAWMELPIGAIDRLLDCVKTAVLGYAIEVEKLSPDAGELPVGSKPISEERLTQIFNTHIAGNVGNVANASTGVTQTATVQVGQGDWEALRVYLQSLGLIEADFAGLKRDLDQARAAGPATSEKPASWIGKLVGKAMSKAAGVGVEAIAGGIAQAIAGYLGQ